MSINLYIQTEYSMLNSTIKINKLVEKAKELNFNTLAITDTQMHGTLKFYNECTKNNIKPIIGLKIYIESQFYEKTALLLYAKDEESYKELIKVSTLNEMKDTLLTFDDISRYKSLIVVSAGIESDFDKLILDNNNKELQSLYNKYNSVFDTFYLGLQESNYMDSIYKLGESVVITKTSYLEDNEKKYLGYLRSIKAGKKSPTKVLDEKFKNIDELSDVFAKYVNAKRNLLNIKQECNLELKYSGNILPKYNIGKNIDSVSYIKKLCLAGLQKRFENKNINTNIYMERLKYELKVICEMGFEDYFLIVFDLVSYAKKNNILVGPGRGSACGSLVSYCLGIIDIDPLQFGLLFERFLNPERISMPDIDLDFPDNKRDQVIQYVNNKYGKYSVAHISTFSKLQSKSAIRDVARVMELRKEKLDDVLSQLGGNTSGLRNTILNNSELKSMLKDEDIKELLEVATNIEGLVRQTSTHAAGIIINDKSILGYTALSNGLNGVMQTQFEAKDLEEIGLLKIDFLGLRNLSIIDDVVSLINKDNKNFNIKDIPFNDEKTFKIIASGDTDGLFQLESKGMRSTLKKMKVNSFNDIVAALALYRPGPMENINVYCDRKLGKEKVDYIHNDIVEILESTYGIIIYQEQIMEIVRQFANYSLGEADILRRAVSKKVLSVLEDERSNFVRKSKEVGHDEDVSNRIYDYIVKFANYGFNKAHSVAYATIAYQLGYLKANYKKEFMAVMLSNSLGNSTFKQYVNDCRRNGIKILAPDVNKSSNSFKIEDNSIRLPLLSIKGITQKISQRIFDEKELGEFKSYNDFFKRTNEYINNDTFKLLVYASALDSFGETKKDLLLNTSKSGMLDFEELEPDEYIINRSKNEYTLDELIDLEKSAFGFNLNYSSFDKYEPFKEKNNLMYIAEALEYKQARLLVKISEIKSIKTKNNEDMAFVTFVDNDNSVEGVMFPKTYTKFINEIEVNGIYAILSKIEVRQDKKQLIVENLRRVNL